MHAANTTAKKEQGMRIATPPWTPNSGASRAVALEVLLNGPLSRSDIARKLDLSAGSLTRLSAPLIASGLLVEVEEKTDGRAGRPSQPLDIVPSVCVTWQVKSMVVPPSGRGGHVTPASGVCCTCWT